MFPRLLCALCIIGLVNAVAPGDDGLASGAKRLVGTWAITENIVDGTTTPQEVVRDAQLVVKSDSYQNWRKGEADTGGGWKFVAKRKNVFHIDLYPTSGPGEHKVVKGIVEFIDDGFRLCMPAEPDGVRPTAFSAEAGSRQFLRTYKRLDQ